VPNEITPDAIESFSKGFIEQIKKSNKIFESMSSFNKEDYLPNAFSGDSVLINSIYSTDREHILIVFNRSNEYKFVFNNITGNVFDFYDPFKKWGKGSGFRIENCLGIKMKSNIVIGQRPMDLYGEIELYSEDFRISVYSTLFGHLLVPLDFVMVFSKEIFMNKFQEQERFANNLVLNYADYFIRTGEKYNSTSKKAQNYIKELQSLKVKMEDYFFRNKYRETKIDNFIGNNPLIVKCGLGLINYISPMTLKDVHGEYKQDLKPDLVGYDPIQGHWTIVDYKLPWKNLIRGAGTVRASVTSDITQLHSQIKTYRDYFLDHNQREWVNRKYKIDIKKYPPTIGVIGTVSEDERDDFNALRHEYPGWFKIISYDELYKRVCEYIDFVNNVD
jgi:hypothetical protein